MKSGVIERSNVQLGGVVNGRPMVFAHGYGCDQNMWRFIEPRFRSDHRTVLFDHLGAGGSDLSAYDPDRHASLEGYADDVIDILEALDLSDVVLVGHSVSAMIGALVAGRSPDRVGALVMIGPSPRYLDDPDTGYVGGFSETDIEGLLDALESNYLGWATSMAPAIMGNPDRPALGAELTESFCRTDPEIQKRFARATFLADNRADLDLVRKPSLILQCSEDIIAPDVVGTYVHQRIPNSVLVRLQATGHCPHLSAPEETVDAMNAFLGRT